MASTVKISQDSVSILGHAWSSKIVDETIKASAYHDLIISSRPVARMNDLTEQEETDCWRLALAIADNTLNRPNIKSAGLIVNEGPSSGQSVGHVHIHVLGFDHTEYCAPVSFVEGLDLLTSLYTPQTQERSVDHHRLLDPETFAFSLRRTRELRTIENDQPTSFSICSARAVSHLKEGISMTIKSFTQQGSRKYGLTNLTRVMRGPIAEPYAWDPDLINRTFEPVM